MPSKIWRFCVALLRIAGVCITISIALLTVLWIFPLLSHRNIERFVQTWSKCMLTALGLNLAIRDFAIIETECGRLLVANHVSFIDILALNAVSPSSFVAKAEIKAWPLLGKLVSRAGTIFIERGNRRAAHAVQDRIRQVLGGGGQVAIFPEGTTTEGDSVLPFHSALFQSAIDAGAQTVCLAIIYQTSNGTQSLAPTYAGETSLLQCLWRTVIAKGLTVTVAQIGVFPASGTDRRHLAHSAHQRISHYLRSAVTSGISGDHTT